MLMNAHLQKYNSRFVDPFSSGIDALDHIDWGHENNYVNVPFRMLYRVLDGIIAEGAEATMKAPELVAQP